MASFNQKFSQPYSTNVTLNTPDIGSIQNAVNINQNLDAFQRLRVSLPSTQYEYNFQYNKAPLIWDETIGGTGTSTHVPTQSTVRLATGSARSPALVKLAGYGDSLNGVFIGQDDTGVFFLLRSSASGVADDTRKIYQTNWNLDKFDGSGSSKVTLDITKTQIFVSDIQWLGVGRVRCGLEYNGQLYWCHQFLNTNLLDKVYTTTMNLPLLYSIVDGANSVSRQTFQYFRYRPGKSLMIIMTFNMYAKTTATLDQICSAVITETSNDTETSYTHAVDSGITAKTVSARTNVISVRPKLTFNSITNRGTLKVETLDVLLSGAGTVKWELIYNPVVGGSPVYNSAGTYSIAEYDVAGTTITGGEVVASGYASGTNTIKIPVSRDISSRYPLSLNTAGNSAKILTLACTPLSGTVDVLASMNLVELY